MQKRSRGRGSGRGTLQETEAAYDAAVAAYRQTVLTAFQQVADHLAALRILAEEAGAEDKAVQAAARSLEITSEQYRNGSVDYLQVITAHTALLSAQAASIGILTNRMVANVSLVQALGGGWDASELPSTQQLRS